MSSALLREAADRLDALADAATPGPWEDHENYHAEHNVCEVGRGLFGVVASPSRGRADYGRANAAYIAAMSPTVGKALARIMRFASVHEAVLRRFAVGIHTDLVLIARAVLGRDT